MALPVAQLGYLPNVSPQSAPVIQKRNPWAELGMAVLQAAAQQGVSNAMSRDYASQSTAEAPEKVAVGPAISPETGKPVSNAAPTVLGPQDAPWWSKILSGPTMGAQQYGQITAQRAAASEGRASREHQTQENTADRQARDEAQRRQLLQAAAQFSQNYDLSTKELGLKERALQSEDQYRQGSLDVQRKGSIPANMAAQADLARAEAAAGPRAAAESASVRLFGEYQTYLHNYAKEKVANDALAARGMAKPLPPPLTIDEFIQQYNATRPALGLEQFSTQP